MAAAPAGRARQGRDSLEHKVTLTQNDSSSAGLFWAAPGAGCVQTPRRKLGSGEDVSNQPQPPRFILSRGGSVGAEPGLRVGAASGTQPRPRAGVVAPGSGEAAGQQGWPGRSSWSIASRPDTAGHRTHPPQPQSFIPLREGPRDPQPGPCPVGSHGQRACAAPEVPWQESTGRT